MFKVAAEIPPTAAAPVILTLSPASNPAPVSLMVTLEEPLSTLIGSFLSSLAGIAAIM